MLAYIDFIIITIACLSDTSQFVCVCKRVRIEKPRKESPKHKKHNQHPEKHTLAFSFSGHLAFFVYILAYRLSYVR